MKTKLIVGEKYWLAQTEVEVLNLVPDEAEATKDAQVQSAESGEVFWVSSRKLKAKRVETMQERFERQAAEAQAEVKKNLDSSDFWMSEGGKEIATVEESSFITNGFHIASWEWGRFEHGITISHADAESLYQWMKERLGH